MIDIRHTFREHEILLTGSSGFLGKIILGLLIDRYPDFRHLHVIVRPAHGMTATERFERDVLGSPALEPVMERVRSRQDGARRLAARISVWPGELSQPALGLDSPALARLAGRVGLIINSAGRVDFFPPLDDSLSANVEGVEHMVALARRIGARLLHVSTAFVCGEADGLVEETDPIEGFYPHRQGLDDQSFDGELEIRYARERIAEIYRSSGANGNPAEFARRRPRELAQRLTSLGRQRAEHWGWVNTYTYSKSLGEQVLAASQGVKWSIVRPAIIESALAFPFPGWIEGGRTAAPLVLMAIGGMKEWPMRRDAALEVVPVDEVAAATLVAGALLLDGSHRPVYHLASADVNPLYLEPLVRLITSQARLLDGTRPRQPFVNRLAMGGVLSGPVRFLNAAAARARREQQERRIERMQKMIARLRMTLEKIGGPGRDTLAGWSAELRTLGLQSSFREQTIEQYLPFVLHNRFMFECQNIRAGYGLIAPEDRERLPWAPEKINWERYWTENQIQGIQKWVQPEAVKEWSFKI